MNGDVGHRVDLNLAGQHALRATAELEVEQLAREAAFLHGQHQLAAVDGEGLGPVRATVEDRRDPSGASCRPGGTLAGRATRLSIEGCGFRAHSDLLAGRARRRWSAAQGPLI